MDKVKVLRAGSKEYSARRIDYFLIKKIPTLHENICAFVFDLNIEMDEFDREYVGFEGVLVSGDENHKIIVTEATDDFIWLMIDTRIEKENIMEIAEKYFFF